MRLVVMLGLNSLLDRSGRLWYSPLGILEQCGCPAGAAADVHFPSQLRSWAASAELPESTRGRENGPDDRPDPGEHLPPSDGDTDPAPDGGLQFRCRSSIREQETFHGTTGDAGHAATAG